MTNTPVKDFYEIRPDLKELLEPNTIEECHKLGVSLGNEAKKIDRFTPVATYKECGIKTPRKVSAYIAGYFQAMQERSIREGIKVNVKLEDSPLYHRTSGASHELDAVEYSQRLYRNPAFIPRWAWGDLE